MDLRSTFALADQDESWGSASDWWDSVSGGDPADVVGEELARLEMHTVDLRQAVARQYAAIASMVDAARRDPTAWTGPDPTADRAWMDPRGRSIAAVRRDRVEFAERAVICDIAVRLRLTEAAVRARRARADALTQRCPLVWQLFRDGMIDQQAADVVADCALSLPDGDRSGWEEFDAQCADASLRLNTAKLRIRVRVIRERVHPESLDARHARARADRGVWLDAQHDGMAALSVILPADAAHRAYGRIDAMARGLAASDDEARTLAQLRADVCADLLTGQAATDRSDRPTVAITVPVMTLLGAADEPATLDGYGPIDTQTARRLAGEATSWVRIMTHPITGTVLDVDRTTYRVPAALRRWLGVHHSTCSFPGCRRAARDCEMDHRIEWHRGGATSADNLSPLCASHHRVRHGSRWQPDRTDGGLTWTSPTGHTAPEDPPPF